MTCPLPTTLSILPLPLVLLTHVPVQLAISHTSTGRSPWILFLTCQSTISTLAAMLVVNWPAPTHCLANSMPVLLVAAHALLSLVTGAGYLYSFPAHLRSPPPEDAHDPDGYWTDVGPKPLSVARRSWWRVSLSLTRDVGWFLVLSAVVVAVVVGIGNLTLSHVVGGGFGVLATLLVGVQHVHVLDDAWHGGYVVVVGQEDPREWGASWIWAVKAVADTAVAWSVAQAVGGGTGVVAWASLAASAGLGSCVLGARGARAGVRGWRGAVGAGRWEERSVSMEEC